VKGIFLSLTRQVLFLIPLVLILPRFFGIDGIVYAGPISDAVAVLTAVGMVMYEFKDMRKLEKEMKNA
jgi:Na+-driven multidrug efflux pump